MIKDGFQMEKYRRIGMSLVIVLLLTIGSYSVYQVNNKDNSEDKNTTMFSQYYDYPGLGENYYWAIDVPIQWNNSTPLPVLNSNLSIYSYNKPMFTSDIDYYNYVSDFNYNVTHLAHSEFSLSSLMYSFYNATIDIGVCSNGALSISFDNSYISESDTNITIEQGIKIANEYLSKHNMLPNDNYTRIEYIPMHGNSTGNEWISGDFIIWENKLKL